MKTRLMITFEQGTAPYNNEMLESLITGETYVCPFTDIKPSPADIAKAALNYIAALEKAVDNREDVLDAIAKAQNNILMRF